MKDTSSSFGVSGLICIMLLRDAIHLGSLLMLQQNSTQANVTDAFPRLWIFKESHASGAAFSPFHERGLRVLLLLTKLNKRLRFLRAAHGRVVPCRFSVRHTTSFTPVDVWVTEVSMLLGVHAVGCGSHAVYI